MTDRPAASFGVDPNAIEAALEAARRPVMIESGAQAGRALKAWRRAEILALDTEFVRERTYRADLGLVQVSDGQTVWLVDPLVEDTRAPIETLLTDPAITKLFHGCSEDLEVLWHTLGALPEPLIDTQVACALLGENLQVGYHHAMADLLGVEIEKDVTRSNWCKRPLTERQVRYAALDVCVLPLAWSVLDARLRAAGRLDWLAEECARLLATAREEIDPEVSWQRIKGNGRLRPESLAILQRLAAWREVQARQRNLPRGFVVSDSDLLAIAEGGPEDVRALGRVTQMHPRGLERHGERLVGLVREAQASGETVAPLPRLSRAQQKRLKAMRSLVQDEATALGVEPALLAARKELEQLLHGADADDPMPERLGGWRRDVVAERLLELAREE